MRWLWTGGGIALALATMVSSASAPPRPVVALSPVEVWADGFHDLRGIVIDADGGGVYVADAGEGTVTRIAPDHTRVVVARRLDHPSGLALDQAGRLLVVEEHGGRVVRVEENGVVSTLAAGLDTPRWLAVASDGRVFVAARRPATPGEARGHGSERDDGGGHEAILVLGADGHASVVAGGFRRVDGLAAGGDVLYAATRERGGDADDVAIVALSLGPGGGLRRLPLARPLKDPRGVAIDRLGALFVGARDVDEGREVFRRAVAKVRADGATTVFAWALEDPQGVAFAERGDLFVADGGRGRVLRFAAPAAPVLAALPAFTNQSPSTLRGRAEAGARVDVFANDIGVAETYADSTGAFAVAVALTPDAENRLDVVATGRAGDGLVSAVAAATMVHDGLAPAVALRRPTAGMFVRGLSTVEAEASDAGSGIAALGLAADGRALAAAASAPLPAPAVVATAAWDTTLGPDGAATLTALATDRAGNTAGANRVVIVDNTPPDTFITEGPPDLVRETTVTFAFSGADNVSPPATLQFAWRLDGGAWTAFAFETRAAVDGLAPGPHVFEVKARDQAGNEAATAARRSFTVSRLGVTITEPVDGATVAAGMVLVQGTVETGGAEAGVTVNGVPAAVDGGRFAALIPVSEPAVTLAARVATASAEATHAVTVAVVATAAAAPVLLPDVSSGPAPLTVGFTMVGGPVPSRVDLDADGDGRTDFTGPTLDGATFTYGRPGVYVARLTGIAADGAPFGASAVVQVFDRAALDGLLQARWLSLRGALGRGDVTGAVALFAAASREAYGEIFTALAGAGGLAQVAADLGTVRLVRVWDRAAEYETRGVRNGVEYSFHVLFVMDEDGLWRLRGF